MHSLHGLPFILLALCACAPGAERSRELARSDEALTSALDHFTLTLRVESPTPEGFVIVGRASHMLASVRAIAGDDEIGTTSVRDRSFRTQLTNGDVTGLITGAPLRFTLQTKRGATHYAEARLELSVPSTCRRDTFDFAPVFESVTVRGTPVVRFAGETSFAATSCAARFVGAEPEPVWKGAMDSKRFAVDVPLDIAVTAALTQTAGHFKLRGSERALTDACIPRVRVGELALSDDDPDLAFPAFRCAPALRTCLRKHPSDTSPCGNSYEVATCGTLAPSRTCGKAVADRLANTVRAAWWTSETDARLTPFVLPTSAEQSLEQLLREESGASPDAPVEVRALDDVLAWPAQDRAEDGPAERMQAAHYRTRARQLRAWLEQPRVVRVGEIRIDVYFVGRDPCGNWVGLKTLAVET